MILKTATANSLVVPGSPAAWLTQHKLSDFGEGLGSVLLGAECLP